MLGHGERGRLGSQASLDDLLVDCREMVKHLGGQTACAGRTSLFYRAMAQKQMVFELACPLLLTGVVDQMMNSMKANGNGELDHAGLVTLVEQMAGQATADKGGQGT